MTEDNRIREIRVAIADFERYGTNGPRTPGQMLRDVSDILDSAPSAPRVFFPGDTVPKGVAVTMMAPLPESGDEHVYVMHEATWDYSVDPGYPVVELITPSPQAWQATVDRAHQARLAGATAQPLLSDPGTGEA